MRPSLFDGLGAASDTNVFQQSAEAYTGGLGALQLAANPFAVNATMNQFMNPYREQVVDNAVSRLRDRRALDMNQVQTDAANASAFGGARHGLVEAELIDRYGQEEDALVSRLLQEGFDTSNRFSLANLGRVQSSGGGLVNAAPIGYNLGLGALQGQQVAGAAQQSLIQSVLDQAGVQTENYINYPQQSLATALAGVAGNPLAQQATQTSTQRYNPGLFDVASFGAGLFGAMK